MNEYLSDEELLQYIAGIEKCDLVDAPHGITEKVLDKIYKKDQIVEYRKFRNKVIAAVACILVLTVIVPEWIKFRSGISASELIKNEEKVDLAGSQIFGGLCDTHYISDFMNGREE